MSVEPANRARPPSFPPKAPERSPYTLILFHSCRFPAHTHASFPSTFQEHDSTCWKPQLTPLWSCRRTGPPCATTHRRQTNSEPQSAPNTHERVKDISKPEFACIPGARPSWASCCRHRDVTTGRPWCPDAPPTGSEWRTTRPTEAAHWERTTCRGACSAFPPHQGMHGPPVPPLLHTTHPLGYCALTPPRLCSLVCASSCRYQLLHNDVLSSMFVTEEPERVGALLDYQRGRLSFYNARSGQLLGTFRQHFTGPCHPALALEAPGSLEVSMVPEVPGFTDDR